MPIKVYKVADIIDGELVFAPSAEKTLPGEIRMRGLTRTFRKVAEDALHELFGPHDIIEILRTQQYVDPLSELNKYLATSSYSRVDPVFIPEDKPTQLIYFQDRLFVSERDARASERAEVVLRVKKAVYDEDAELSTLRATVANIEAAVQFQRSGPKRNPIPEDVKLVVWTRDGGHCVRCGSEKELHFDHIIPVAKGGGNSEANIQILCQPCNLKKSDRIAMP
jgi:hypothetical protein